MCNIQKKLIIPYQVKKEQDQGEGVKKNKDTSYRGKKGQILLMHMFFSHFHLFNQIAWTQDNDFIHILQAQ